MHAFILQDWVTIRGGATQVTQSQQDWLDLSPYQDVVLWLDVREQTGSPTITFQTAPAADESLFQALGGASTLVASSSPVVLSGLMSALATPLARYLRWQLNGSGSWDAMFRVFVTANAPGI